MSAELKEQTETEAEKFDRLSRGQDALYLFSPPSHADHSTPLAELVALEDDAEKTAESYVERCRRERKAAADKLLGEALAKLPTKQREDAECYWFLDMSVAVIAAYRRVSVPAVYKSLRVAQAKLLEALPDFRELYPLKYFTHATDEQELQVEHQARDNRGDTTAVSRIDDLEEWQEAHGHSTSVHEGARDGMAPGGDGRAVDDEREFTTLEGDAPRKRKRAGPSVRDYSPPLRKPKPLTAKQHQACARAKPVGLALAFPCSASAYKRAAKSDSKLKTSRKLNGVVLVGRMPDITARHLKTNGRLLDLATLPVGEAHRMKLK
jgi:hypothetical protein